MKIILDTNFLLTCIKQKIDLFFELNKIMPLSRIIIPKQVINELETLKNRKELTIKERDSASLALQIIEKNKGRISFPELGKNTDKSIINYLLNNSDIVAATLDRGIRKHLKNKVKMLTIRGRKRIILTHY